MKRMTYTHSSCQSYEDVGTIDDVEIERGEINVSHIRFHVQFVRGRVFRLELHSERKHHAGPYSLVYYWDGNSWSVFNSLYSNYGHNPVITNADEHGEVKGGGLALSYDLIPFSAHLLCVSDNFCGFHGLSEGEFSINGIPQVKTANVTVDRIGFRKVYRLTFIRDIAGYYRDVEDYWIHPKTHTILRRQSQYTKYREDHVVFTTRDSIHRPKLDTLTNALLIGFSPPRSSVPMLEKKMLNRTAQRARAN